MQNKKEGKYEKILGDYGGGVVVGRMRWYDKK